jgi:hypothetical protein
MDQRIASIYGTGYESDPAALEKLASDELIVSVLRDNNIDPAQLTPEEYAEARQQIEQAYAESAQEEDGQQYEGQEDGQQYEGQEFEGQEYGQETMPEGFSEEDLQNQWDEAEEKAASALWEADRFGRTAAHAFTDELRAIDKVGAFGPVNDLLDKLAGIGDPYAFADSLEKIASSLEKVAEDGGDTGDAIEAAKKEAKKDKKEEKKDAKSEDEGEPKEDEETKESHAIAASSPAIYKLASNMAASHVIAHGINPETGVLFESAQAKEAAAMACQMPELQPLVKEAVNATALLILEEEGYSAIMPTE